MPLVTVTLHWAAEAVWKRYPGAARFPERVDLAVTSKRIALDLTDAVIER